MLEHHRALIADDQPDVLAALQLLLKGQGYQIESAASPAAVLDAVAAREFDVVLIDLNYARDTTSGREGLELVEQIHAVDGTLPIVVMTAWGTIELAVEAMRRGVGDFVLKPWENARLLETLREQVENGLARRERQSRAARDSAEARDVQQGLMPRRVPRIGGCEISDAWRPADELSGDYFDVLPFDERRFGLCIADASGKGTGAALLVSNLQAAVKAIAGPGVAPSALCGRVNEILCQNTRDNRFVTLFYAVVDSEAKRIRYANAGHNAPILVRGDGTVERLEAGGAVAGAFSGWAYAEGEADLRQGDRLVLFTDGIVEVRGEGGEEFGEERVVDLVRRHRRESASEIRHAVMEAVGAFGPFEDDATLVALAIE